MLAQAIVEHHEVCSAPAVSMAVVVANHNELVIDAYRKVFGCSEDSVPGKPKRLRNELGDHLIMEDAQELPSGAALEAVERLLQAEAAAKEITEWQALPRTSVDQRLAVWQGDITTLRIGAVVNAANTGGLGCFVPTHMCIDNVLHRAAGPRLRLACHRELQRQAATWKGELPTGQAMLTPGFNLPAEWVAHTPGPVGEVPEMLAACYRNVLEECRKHRVRSVAFCCISTGLFGYPNGRAAELAVRTVREWLDEAERAAHEGPPQDSAGSLAATAREVPTADAGDDASPPPPPTALPPFDMVIFNVFLDKDRQIYEQLLD